MSAVVLDKFQWGFPFEDFIYLTCTLFFNLSINLIIYIHLFKLILIHLPRHLRRQMRNRTNHILEQEIKLMRIVLVS